jgi:hypothetical protein
MAPLPANDVFTWVPPIPTAVLNETQSAVAGGGSGQYQAYPANTGAFAPMYNYGWNTQTYLSYASAGIVQTYDIEAPTEKPKARTKKAVKE